MSDPAKTPEEIEDVLASVRRLVSDHPTDGDGAAATRGTSAPAPEPAPAQGQPDALVLTPSFRVTDPEDPWVPVETSDESPEDATSDSGLPDAAVKDATDADAPDAQAAEDLIAEIVTADPAATERAEDTDNDGTNWQPDDRLASYDAVGGEEETNETSAEWTDTHDTDDQGDVASKDDIADLARLDGSQLPVTEFESETGDDNWPEGGAEAALLTLVARRDPAPEPVEEAEPEDVGAVDQDMDPEARDTDASAADDETISDETTYDDDAEAEAAHDETVEDDTEQTETAGVAPTQDNAASVDFEQDAATPEQAALDEDEPQGDMPGQDAQGADSSPDEADPLPELADELSDATPVFARSKSRAEEASTASADTLDETSSPFAFPETDEGILDEDTLREIIVDVVREELQGVLGQRITRNVRKMVRREIRLALAVDDLE
ncbi:hypothetical protein [Jannaschia sp. CCS1]|uniref:hypothetical protein n=1 Tax=Jannaschia sp. (strain CCS1) TaxID=290400 RepID=UPI000053B8A2|nr:hypothetical protein [Jannaschia sp. CCS1]ABD56173.1 hypothetical protein Jann_3256 [Jannaschia sp. CCS1]